MRALVVTVVHHPEDSRIRHRQIAALVDAGWSVTYAAPFTGYGLAEGTGSEITEVDLPRSFGTRRVRAIKAARTLLEHRAADHDLVLLHDPELLLALPGLRLPPVVWDVHEDTAAAMTLKPWLPAPLRPFARWVVRRVELWAERRVHLILAEDDYQHRFRRRHPVVRNVNLVPATVRPPDDPRAVYVGSITAARGGDELVEVARILAAETDGRLRLTVIGPPAGDIEASLRAAADDGVLDWRGFLPSDHALAIVEGSIAGMSLLHDEPNYRVSLPTKIVEYMGRGVPVITTPLPLAVELVDQVGCGVVVPFEDPPAVAEAILALWHDPDRRKSMGEAGHRVAREHFDWSTHAPEFIAELEAITTRATTP